MTQGPPLPAATVEAPPQGRDENRAAGRPMTILGKPSNDNERSAERLLARIGNPKRKRTPWR